MSGGSGSGRTNRLSDEKSPYLLQHADNPVAWFPWSAEAFAAAERDDKPVFLSIGYSSCHWCHVMEEESFEDDDVAGLLNEHFVSIKVDREERPDIDATYMKVCQAMTGSGGWPLTIVMTPDKKPFFAGTYFPKTTRFGRPGLMETLTQLSRLWKDDRYRLILIGEKAAEFLSEDLFSPRGGGLTRAVMEKALEHFKKDFDERHGGFGAQPKFPSPHQLSLLLRIWESSGNEEALRMAEKTLDAMNRGGIFDQLGFGFHRYSTDSMWLVPHFEKMLYDQAMLAIAYVEAYQATGRETYAGIAGRIFTYVSNEMTSDEGAFFSSEDADSEGDEGKFYTWRRDEIIDLLGPERGDLVCGYFGITDKGHLDGRSVLHIPEDAGGLARQSGLGEEGLASLVERSRRELLAHREKRIHPFKDDKILTDWNGLMIAALAKGARAMGRGVHDATAGRAADFILEHMRDSSGRLLHRYRGGEAGIRAYLDDYAFLVWGLIELYEASFDARYLGEAIALNEEMMELFRDDDGGGFYLTARDAEKTLSRMKEAYDGAIPSGNSVAALNMLRLGRITMNAGLDRAAQRLFDCFSSLTGRAPTGFAQMLIAYDFAVSGGREIVITGEHGSDDTAALLDAVRARFLPRSVLIFMPAGGEGGELYRLVPMIKGMTMIDGRATAYVCEQYSCKAPVTDAGELVSLLERRP